MRRGELFEIHLRQIVPALLKVSQFQTSIVSQLSAAGSKAVDLLRFS